MKYIEKQILKELNREIKFKDKIIMLVFKKYTLKIYEKGFKDGFNFKRVT